MLDLFEYFVEIAAAVEAAKLSDPVGGQIRHSQQQFFAVLNAGLLNISKNTHAGSGFKDLT